jgi:hypothetical protein
MKTATWKWLKEKLNDSKLGYMKAHIHDFSQEISFVLLLKAYSFVDNSFQYKTVPIIR